MPYHQPVLLQESLAGLAIKPQGTYVDLTFGGGGHAQAILGQLLGGRLLAFDQDRDAAQLASQLQNPAFTFISANARFMEQFLVFHRVSVVDGILADLGVSWHQIDTPTRGFSTRSEALLDMRMDQQSKHTAQEITNTYSLDQLTKLLKAYGEVRPAHALAQAIVSARTRQPIRTTGELKAIVQPFAPQGKHAQYLAQVFQAFRIAVNDELGALQAMLVQSARMLRKGGRLVIIAYHSLEDRLVKRFIKAGNFTGEAQKDVYGNLVRPFNPICKKPILPTEQEVQANPRARSAKLRIGERL
ncbi:MAG: 16S rRNA (cytosine(1402)-N(4))-methyltransferase RsmH [Bacteroidota bacterium]